MSWLYAMALLRLVLTEKGKEGKNQPNQKPLFFKSCIPSVTISVLAEIHPALCPAEIKGYIWVITPGNGKSTLVPSSGEVQPPWHHGWQNPVKFFPGMEELQKYIQEDHFLNHIFIIKHEFKHN